jgi:hypothetical protein
MKNVRGLGNAMRLVESACEKGEITIIGEGRTPSPVELLNKCVDFINKQYGVDVLNLMRETTMRKECGDHCCDCCDCCLCEEEADKKELEVEDILCEIENYLDGTILSSRTIEDILNKMQEYFSVIDFVIDDDYSGIKSSMYTILDQETDGLIVSGGIINADEMVEVIMEIVTVNTLD